MSRLTVFVIGEARHGATSGQDLATRAQKRGPQYADSAVPRQRLIEEREGAVIKSYQHNIVLIQKHITINDPFSQSVLSKRSELIRDCYALAKQYRIEPGMAEEYAVLAVDKYVDEPEALVAKHASFITSFLKSDPEPLDEQEIAQTLAAQLKYAKHDLMIVDWDGACLFEPNGDVETELELLQLANLQLLQYRLLDAELDRRLRHVERLIRSHSERHPWRLSREIRRGLTEIIQVRSVSIMQFDAIQREIKLIGDWYSARCYGLMGRKFKLEDWRKSVREKLDSLEDIYDIVTQNFRISSQTFLEVMIQIGWFTLLMIELFQLWKK